MISIYDGNRYHRDHRYMTFNKPDLTEVPAVRSVFCRPPRRWRVGTWKRRQESYFFYTLPETNSKFAPENKPGPKKERILFQPSIFRLDLLVSGKTYISETSMSTLKQNQRECQTLVSFDDRLCSLLPLHTVDGSEIRRENHLGCNHVNSGINYQPQLVQDFSHQQYHQFFK